MSVEIPVELQPQIAAAIARGSYANEQELVIDILRVAVPVLGQYQQIRADVQESLTELQQGKTKVADLEAIRLQLDDEFGNRK